MVDGGYFKFNPYLLLLLFARFMFRLVFVLFWELATTSDMLNFLLEYAHLPLAPNHYLTIVSQFSVTVSQIVAKLSFVDISVGPLVDPITMLLILSVLSLVDLPIVASPAALSLANSILKLTNILFFAVPNIVPSAMRVIPSIISPVDISLAEHFKALA